MSPLFPPTFRHRLEFVRQGRLLASDAAWLGGVLFASLTFLVPAVASPPPVQAFLYVEPFELRLEILLRLRSVSRIPESGVLDLESQAARLDELKEPLRVAWELVEEGRVQSLALDDIRFLTMDPALGPTPDERELIPVHEALVGAVFVTARDGLPESLELTWKAFALDGTNFPEVPLVIELSDRLLPQKDRVTLTPETPSTNWSLPEFASALEPVEVRKFTTTNRAGQRVISAGFLGLGAVLLGISLFRLKRGRFELTVCALIVLLLGGASMRQTFRESDTDWDVERASALVEALIRNVYSALHYREESAVFDALARSVDGPLLEEVYLDLRRRLDAEGPRVRIHQVAVNSCEVIEDGRKRGLTARASWSCLGTVSHWGHSHRRAMVQTAELRAERVDGAWKLVRVDILDEHRKNNPD